MSEKPAILGGTPVRTQPFPDRTTMGEAEKTAAIEVLDSDNLSGFIGGPGPRFNGGPRVKEFERQWGEKYGYKHVITCNSWTSGLVICVGAVGVGPGDEVICSPYTMSASATCALFYGAVPVFADVDPENFCLSPDSIKERITERTKAIVVVHIFGQPADMDEILEIAREHDIAVIEDAAQAPGTTYRGEPVGALGDIGGFSLNVHKHIHTGEGGIIVTNDDELAHRCRLIRNHGENSVTDTTPADRSNLFGGNYRFTELQAAIASAQLQHRLDPILETRRDLARHLASRLEGLPGLRVPEFPEDRTHAFYVFPLKYDAGEMGISRRVFVRSVLAELPKPDKWETTPLTEGYVEPLHLLPLFQNQEGLGDDGFPFTYNEGVEYDYSEGICPVVERLYSEELLLTPLVREPLTRDDIDDLATAIHKVCEHAAEIGEQIEDDVGTFTPLAAVNESAS